MSEAAEQALSEAKLMLENLKTAVAEKAVLERKLKEDMPAFMRKAAEGRLADLDETLGITGKKDESSVETELGTEKVSAEFPLLFLFNT